MQVTEVANDGLKRAYTVVVPAASIAAQKHKRLAELGKDLRIPGFRPGKVPEKVVAARYGQAVMGEVLEASVQEATGKVVSERGLRPALQPKIELVNFADNADLEFRLDVELLPEIPMPDFASIQLTRLKATPGEAEIGEAIDNITRGQATLEEAEARPAAKGEVLVCDFIGRIGDEAFPGGSATDMPIEVAGEGFIPGFTEQLEGLAPGETRTIAVAFPEDYGAAQLAGKEATFEVTAKALKLHMRPPVDDALAQKMGLENVEQLRGRVVEVLQREYDSQSRMAIKRSLLDQLAERAAFTVPDGMVENEFAQIWQRVEADLKAGRLDSDDAGKDEATLKAEYRAIAERRVRLGLLLNEVGRSNNIQVSREELGQAMRAEVSRYPGQEKQVMEFFQKNPAAIENLRSPIFEDKVVDFVLELAQLTEQPASRDEVMKAAQGA
jgi:trigger factor